MNNCQKRKSTANNSKNKFERSKYSKTQSSANSNAHNNISTVGEAKQNNDNSMTKTQSKNQSNSCLQTQNVESAKINYKCADMSIAASFKY